MQQHINGPLTNFILLSSIYENERKDKEQQIDDRLVVEIEDLCKSKLCRKLLHFSHILAKSVASHGNSFDCLSPQMDRKIISLLTTSYLNDQSKHLLIRRCSQVFDRLLLELILAHYTTNGRQKDFLNAVKDKGCYAKDPKLSRFSIECLLKLFEAAGSDSALERRNVVDFISNNIAANCDVKDEIPKRTVAKILQTLYKANCFEVVDSNDPQSRNRLKLKPQLMDFHNLFRQYHIGLISIANEYMIRLNPESWSLVLFGKKDQDLAQIQQLLEQFQMKSSMLELENAIYSTNDKYKLHDHIPKIKLCNDMLVRCLESQVEVSEDLLDQVVSYLVDLIPLFYVRRRRLYHDDH